MDHNGFERQTKLTQNKTNLAFISKYLSNLLVIVNVVFRCKTT